MGERVFRPANFDRWDNLRMVMADGENKGQCWCACWHLSDAAFQQGLGAGNRDWLEARLRDGAVPGLIAYVQGEPAGWVGIAPRRSFERLADATTFAALDDLPVWVLTCLIVRPAFRRQGLMSALIRAASVYALDQGAPAVEAFAIEPLEETGPDDLYCGTARAFRAAGYVEVARPLPNRPVMRLYPPGD